MIFVTCLGLMFLVVVKRVDGACTVNSTILSFREDVPEGTVIMAIPRVNGEMWSFREDGPKGFIELQHDGKYVTFLFQKTPDLEEINKHRPRTRFRESLPFTLECQYKGWKHVAVVLIDVNDNTPVFNLKIPLKTHISEVTSVGAIVFNLRHLAEDKDISGRVVGYSIHRHKNKKLDGFGYFEVASGGHDVILKKNLDYDTMKLPYFMLNISAYDNGYPVPRRGYTSLKVSIDDVDDLGPVFVYRDCPVVDGFCSTPVYETVVVNSYQGSLKIWPDSIQAKDKDNLNNTILYSITKVDPEELKGLFKMNENTGEITLQQSLDRFDINKIHIGIKVEEDSVNRRSLTTNLRVQIRHAASRFINGGFREIPINDIITIDKYGDQSLTSIPFSIFMSTVGLFLVIIGVMLIVFVKYFKERPTTAPLSPQTGIHSNEPTRPPPPPPPPKRASSSRRNSSIAPSGILYPSQEQNFDSPSPSSGSSVNLDFDDAISFAASRCRGSSMTSLPLSSNMTCHHPNTSGNGDENVGQILKRKLHTIFHNREPGQSNTTKCNRVRFDIRNISSFS